MEHPTLFSFQNDRHLIIVHARANYFISRNFSVLRGVGVGAWHQHRWSPDGMHLLLYVICISRARSLRLCFLSTSCKGSRHSRFVHSYLDYPPLTSIPP
jgi:hypothetical protein